MWTSIDLCIVPLGSGVSLAPYLAACKKVINQAGLDYEIGPNGTALEGEWEEVFACVKACHETVHKKGAGRIFTTLKINTRTDKKQSFREKVNSVELYDSEEVLSS